MLRLILQENLLRFDGEDYLQAYETAMGMKTAVAFAYVSMAKIGNEILTQSCITIFFWKKTLLITKRHSSEFLSSAFL